MFSERSNGRYNDRTFPKDRSVVWRGNGVDGVRTDTDVFEFRVWDPTSPIVLGRKVVFRSPDGKRTVRGTVLRYDHSGNLGENERGKSVNCGVMVLDITSES